MGQVDRRHRAVALREPAKPAGQRRPGAGDLITGTRQDRLPGVQPPGRPALVRGDRLGRVGVPEPARQPHPLLLDLLQLLTAELVHDVGLHWQRRPPLDLAAVELLPASQREQPQRRLRPRQVVPQHLQEPGVGRVDQLPEHLGPARTLLVAAGQQRHKRRAVGNRCGQQPFDLPDRAGDDRPGRDHAAGEPLSGVGCHGRKVGRERGQPSQIGSPLRGGRSGLLERHHAQQQSRPVAMADRHVPHRPQPVQVVGQPAQLTARQRHGQRQRPPLLGVKPRGVDAGGSLEQAAMHPMPLRAARLGWVGQHLIEAGVAHRRREQRLDRQESVPVRIHDLRGPARHPPPRSGSNPTGTPARMAVDGRWFHSAGRRRRPAPSQAGPEARWRFTLWVPRPSGENGSSDQRKCVMPQVRFGGSMLGQVGTPEVGSGW